RARRGRDGAPRRARRGARDGLGSRAAGLSARRALLRARRRPYGSRTMSRESVLDVALRYLRALERSDRAALEQLLDETIVQRELPNRLRPQGGTADRATMLRSFERGATAVREQQYEVQRALVERDRAALEVRWTAIVNLPLGTLSPGDRMCA